MNCCPLESEDKEQFQKTLFFDALHVAENTTDMSCKKLKLLQKEMSKEYYFNCRCRL